MEHDNIVSISVLLCNRLLLSRSPCHRYIEDLGPVETVSESRLVGVVLGLVGTGAIAWGLFARPEFGDVITRFHSLTAVLSDDRSTSARVCPLPLVVVLKLVPL